MDLADLAAQLEQLRNDFAQLRARVDCPACRGSGLIDAPGGWAHGFACAQCHGTGLRHTRTLGGPSTSAALVPDAPAVAEPPA